MKIAAPHLANLLEFAKTLNIDVEAVKKKFLKNPDMELSLIQNNISDDEMSGIIQELVVLSGDKNFGLHYGCFMNLQAMGLIYNISKKATSIEQVILILKEFLQGTFPVFELIIIDEEGELTLNLLCIATDEQVKKHLSDASLCIMYRELRSIVDSSCKIEVGFPRQEIEEIKRLIGDEAVIKENHSISFNKINLNHQLHKTSLFALGELLPAYMLLIETAKSSKNNNFSDQVRHMVLNMCSPELPDIEQVAAQFCMSTRSFQRKLNVEGNSFRAIADEIKHKLSDFLEKDGHLKTKEIAYLLGYAESSAYLHAAKKWKKRN